MTDAPKLLLCIEDDPDDVAWIEETVAEMESDLIIVSMSNGLDALKYLERQKEKHYLPCLILLDLNMPVMDGKQTLVAIKKDPALQEIPVIVFTTSSSGTDALFCKTYGADLVTKPHSHLEIKRTLRKLIQPLCDS